MKKFLILTFTIILIVTLSFMVVSCNNNDDENIYNENEGNDSSDKPGENNGTDPDEAHNDWENDQAGNDSGEGNQNEGDASGNEQNPGSEQNPGDEEGDGNHGSSEVDEGTPDGDQEKIDADDLKNVSFTGKTVEYTGMPQSIVVNTTLLPEGVSVTYQGNGRTNAGVYTVRAKFYFKGEYISGADKTAVLKINKATLKLPPEAFSDAIFDFDGQNHSITIDETLIKQGFTVSYEGNNVYSIGKHIVKAVFKVKDPANYEVPAPITAILTINPGNYATEDLIYQLNGNSYEIVGYTGSDKSVIIPSTYDGKPVTSIASEAFKDNRYITYVYLPETVTNIGNNAFKNCYSLEIFNFAKVQVIGQNAFENTNIKKISLPDTLISIGKSAFRNVNVVSFTLPFIGGSADSSNRYLGFIFGAPSHIANSTYVPSTLGSVTLSDACGEIAPNAFYGCSSISEIIIGENISKIGNGAFYKCTGLRYIYLPSSVTNIPANVAYINSPFNGCSEKLFVVLEGDIPDGYNSYWNYISESEKALIIKNESFNDYLTNRDSYEDEDMSETGLEAIYLNGVALSGFSTAKLNYTSVMDINTGYGTLTYKTLSCVAAVEITETEKTLSSVTVRIKVTGGDRISVTEYYITFNVSGTLNSSGNEIVNKNGTDATVTYVIDDGDQKTGSFAAEMLGKYSYLNLSFAIPTKNFVTFNTEETDNGKLQYVMDGDRYTYTVKNDAVTFWKNILDNADGRAEIVNHTDSHAYWGQNDDGGTFTYVDNNNNIKTATMPIGSSTKEMYGANQVIEELFPSYLYPSMSTTTFINAGIGVKMGTVTIDGIVYPSYYAFFQNVINKAYADGEILGMRSTFTVQDTTGSASKVILPENFTTADQRLNIPAFMVKDGPGDNSGNGIENWTAYIDHAIDQNGWACFCIHNIRDDQTTGHYITTANADALFGYTEDKNVWVASINDATKYYREWSTAKLSTVYQGETIKVTLTDGEDNEICDMALTVKIYTPVTWDKAMYNDTVIDVHEESNGRRYVLVDIIPDSGVTEIKGICG